MRSERKQGCSAEQVPVSAYGGSLKNLKDLKDLLFGSFLRKGEVLAYVGRIHNLKDLKDRTMCASARPLGQPQTPQQNHPLSPLHEPLHWRAKRDPKA